MNNNLPKFKVGDEVKPITGTGKTGVILSEPRLVNGKYFYEVFFSAEEKTFYEENKIETKIVTEKYDSISTYILERKLASYKDFMRYLTLLKLETPLTDNLYAFLSSRTEFNVYQFKPLLKFLSSPYQRLLIADEVGIGKTIEAGIIFTELKSRQDITNVWIFCPFTLVPKWKDEMESRFDEKFEVIYAERLQYIFREYERYEEILYPYNQAICSLHPFNLYCQKIFN